MDSYELIKLIKEANKKTPCRAYLQGDLQNIDFSILKAFGDNNFKIVFGEYNDIYKVITNYQDKIKLYYLENDRRLSAIPLLDYTKINARIEPGAVIRDFVTIENNVVIMMGAVINVGAHIGAETMIDMNAVVGGRAIIGKRCHIGAGSVIAGVIEPPSKMPVIIEDDCLIGANAVILEGIRIGKGAIVGAGSIVIKDVEPGTVVAGNPAKFIKFKDEKAAKKSEIVDDLRK